MLTSERIKLRRKDLGISIEEMQKRTNRSRATLYRYENGAIGNVPLSELTVIAQALQTTPAYLLGFTDNVKETSPQGSVSLTETEDEILRIFQKLTAEKQIELLQFARFLYVST